MTWFDHGRIERGAIVLSKPLPLPEGTEVTVRIDSAAETAHDESSGATDTFVSLPFFGMWADRYDMVDSTAWVQREREQWQQRVNRRD